MTTILWQIDWMDVSSTVIAGQTEVVLTAQWRCIGSDGTNEKYAIGICAFPEPSIDGNYTPYAQLTQSQVLGWCYANGVDQEACEVQVAQELEAINNPPTIQPPLPWNS
jgi:hypothetical protein